MIRSFEIKLPDQTHIPWIPKVPALAKARRFEFTPGLNILWGRNGTGKSTIIKAIARLLHCEQSGTTHVTGTSLNTLFEGRRFGKQESLKDAVAIDHDGQATRYFDPSNAVGLIGGMAAFDYDFGLEGIHNAIFKGSAGQTTMFRFDKLIAEIIEDVVPKVERQVPPSDRTAVADFFLKGSGENGPPTILLDEPERSLDLPNQVAVWRLIRAASSKVQFIVAAHSLYGLNLPEANYIELDDQYLGQSLICLSMLSKWRNEKPEMPTPAIMKKAKEEATRKPKKKKG